MTGSTARKKIFKCTLKDLDPSNIYFLIRKNSDMSIIEYNFTYELRPILVLTFCRNNQDEDKTIIELFTLYHLITKCVSLGRTHFFYSRDTRANVDLQFCLITIRPLKSVLKRRYLNISWRRKMNILLSYQFGFVPIGESILSSDSSR